MYTQEYGDDYNRLVNDIYAVAPFSKVEHDTVLPTVLARDPDLFRLRVEWYARGNNKYVFSRLLNYKQLNEQSLRVELCGQIASAMAKSVVEVGNSE